MFSCLVDGKEICLVCPICDGDDFATLDEASSSYQCRQCTLGLEARPLADPLGTYERTAYDEQRVRNGHWPSWSRFHHDYAIGRARLSQLTRAQVLPDRTQLERFADYGCGNGAFLAAVRREGHKVLGVELDEAFADEVGRVLGIRVLTTGDFLMHARAHTAQVLTLFDVLEHLIDPVGVLRQAVECLDANGILVLEVPDLSQHDGSLRTWKHYKPGEHGQMFTPLALNTMLERHFSGYAKVHEDIPIPGKLQVVWKKKQRR